MADHAFALVGEDSLKDSPGISETVEWVLAGDSISATTDTLTCAAVPARWRALKLTPVAVSICKYTTSGAVAGAVAKTMIPWLSYTYAEDTGVLVVTNGAIAAANTTTVVVQAIFSPSTTI